MSPPRRMHEAKGKLRTRRPESRGGVGCRALPCLGYGRGTLLWGIASKASERPGLSKKRSQQILGGRREVGEGHATTV